VGYDISTLKRVKLKILTTSHQVITLMFLSSSAKLSLLI